MQLTTKDGIQCDGCAMKLRDDFRYYSIDLYRAKSKFGQHIPIREILNSPAEGTLDYCGLCYEKLQDKIVEINKATGRKTGNRYCDLSNIDLMPLNIYYYGTVTGADVKQIGIPYACEKCDSRSDSPTTVCKCGSNKYIKKADVNTDKRLLEIFITKELFDSFMVRKEKNAKGGGDWNVTS